MLHGSLKRLAWSPAIIAGAAFALRLGILIVVWHKAAPADFRGAFAYETGRVAESIASGRGFSSPLLLVDSGPTAYLCPVYPYLLAGIFKIWGINSFKSHVIAQALNCWFASLTIFPIFAAARRAFGVSVAVLASWLCVILPNAWHMPIAYVWDTSLSALWFALLFWATLALRDKGGVARWAGYGGLWAVGALINATVLSMLPFLCIWLVWEACKQSRPWLRPVVAAGVVFVIGIAPWTIRNYRSFGKFIPSRTPFGLVLWLGNNPSAADENSFSMHPLWNPLEAERFKELGEIAYMSRKEQEALTFMRSNPAETLRRVAERVFAFWFQVTDRPQNQLFADPLYVKALFLFNTAFILFAWLGAGIAWRSGNSYAVAYLIVLLAFPPVYYLTDVLARYRFLIDPVLTILAAQGFSFALKRLNAGWVTHTIKPNYLSG
jgi:hypothetical protein